MPSLKALWNTTESWITAYRARRNIRQQQVLASPVELQSLTLSDFDRSTSYHPVLTDNQDIPSQKPIRFKQPVRSYTKGWRFGALSCALSSSVVFLINLIVTISNIQRHSSAPSVLYDGDCERVKRLNTGIHLLINILSTIILSSSNYCMQCLSAPTRREIDKAHSKEIWVDIGVHSIRNLWRIGRGRQIVWLLLGLSSLPLHLFYNSAVFSSISSNSYSAVTVSQSFIDNENCIKCEDAPFLFPVEDGSDLPGDAQSKILVELHAKAHSGALERLDGARCIAEYAVLIQSNRRNVLLVASDDNFNSSDTNIFFPGSHVYSSYSSSASGALGGSSLDVYDWICSGHDKMLTKCRTDVDQVKSDPENWQVGLYPVQYCLSEKTDPHCKLQFSLAIATLVTALNLFKALLMFYVAFALKDPLITIGDAVASFLEHEDPTTKNMCLLSFKDISERRSGYQTGPKEYRKEMDRWMDVTSKTRRSVAVVMFTFAITIVSILVGCGLVSLPSEQSKSLAALARLGFGAVDPMVVIRWDIKGLIQNALVANAAQPILSFLYFSYNGIFTAMLSGYEWCTYSTEGKGLRLSRASEGSQRSTYFLQLPYRFAVPLMAVSGLLHWFVSQSIFLIAIDYYDYTGKYISDAKVCGFSPIAIIAVLVLGVFMLLFMIGFGYIPHKPGIPLAGSCSLAISAACHIEEWTDYHPDTSKHKLKWGVVEPGLNREGHCAFSPKQVDLPEHGKLYAGALIQKKEETAAL